ncbi:hypothetical protein HPP92_004811 [Vanilla planifolia]|uniref:Uncharacterized protein n=1 Tax=Vanilla planifolia TaxID=51239 RepID=A0A835RY83_VANPL|nr:hypothetical protein HPP92_005174 [Vanilla planifolia]KAG0493817.1 hypothetical protein HPP92_004811 [Vanilla planifolia]
MINSADAECPGWRIKATIGVLKPPHLFLRRRPNPSEPFIRATKSSVTAKLARVAGSIPTTENLGPVGRIDVPSAHRLFSPNPSLATSHLRGIPQHLSSSRPLGYIP